MKKSIQSSVPDDKPQKLFPDKSNYPAIQQMLIHALEFSREHPELSPEDQKADDDSNDVTPRG